MEFCHTELKCLHTMYYIVSRQDKSSMAAVLSNFVLYLALVQ